MVGSSGTLDVCLHPDGGPIASSATGPQPDFDILFGLNGSPTGKLPVDRASLHAMTWDPHRSPHQIMTIINWSFASNATDAEIRRLVPTIDYHYEYASFHLTDTDLNSGAHVMMKRSHNKKPLQMLLGSAAASEAAVRQQYGIENEIIIEGPAGTGSVQDTSCYHRATPPTYGDRLMLAVRFIKLSLELIFGASVLE